MIGGLKADAARAAENMARKQRAEGYRTEAGALESRLALIKPQRNKLLAAFEGFAGNSLCNYNYLTGNV